VTQKALPVHTPETRSIDPSSTDWREQARHAIRDLAGLERAIRLTDEERRGVERALSGGFPLSITPYYLSLIDPDDPSCPIRRQVVPTAHEGVEVPGDLVDPLGEVEHEVAPELIRRYPDRVLLLATDRCAVYCRFCTRSRMVGDGGGARSLDVLEPAFRYIEENTDLHEVIVSGGDPMVMSTSRLVAIFERLAQIPHIGNVRLATRAPVTIPQRVTDELCEALERAHPSIWVMTHFNHPKEITEASREACARLVDHGIPVMNQTVLLRGVNDDPAVLEQLFRGLVRMRVRPYYLLQADPVRGTGHLRTPLQRGMEILARLQGRLSGIALPKLVVDTPGGRGKVVVGPDVIVDKSGGRTTLRTFRGELVDYLDPPEGR
jgi:lysine 2,3-aminomutase